MILKARALNGAFSFVSLDNSISEFFGSIPFTEGISKGEGRKSITASSNLCIPLFLNADPHKVGMNVLSKQPLRTAALISFIEISSSVRYFSIKCSS